MPGTALALAAALAKRHGIQWMAVGYQVVQAIGGILEPGSVVRVHDEELFGDMERIGIVQETMWTEDKYVEVLVHIPMFTTGQAA